MSFVRLQGVFLKDYTPESETKRLRGMLEALGLCGEEVEEALVERRVLYLEKIYEADGECQVALPQEEQEQEHVPEAPTYTIYPSTCCTCGPR